ncbi:MAG: hypothetical protein SGARI_004945 [Bacillariaceae sp.]
MALVLFLFDKFEIAKDNLHIEAAVSCLQNRGGGETGVEVGQGVCILCRLFTKYNQLDFPNRLAALIALLTSFKCQDLGHCESA